MAKRVKAILFLVLVAGTFAAAAEYRQDYVTVISDLEPAYARFAAANADAFCKSLSGFFRTTKLASLTIHYAKDRAEAHRLLLEHGHKDASAAYCARGAATVYAFADPRDDRASHWGGLFADITSCFVRQCDPNAPAWFEQGLRQFFATQGCIVKGQLVIAHPAPGQQAALKTLIYADQKRTVTSMFSRTDRRFDSWEGGADFAQFFFYWLYENGFLQQYVTAAPAARYSEALLEEVTSRTSGRVNIDLHKFMQNNYRAADLVAAALASTDPNEKKAALSEALTLRPNYQAAKLELAKCLYKENDIQKSREMFAGLMGSANPVEFRQAAQWMAASFDAEKDSAKAIEYYIKAWDASAEYEYRYRLAYQIASGYYRLHDEPNAKIWYRKFLDDKWDPGAWTQQADFANKYLGQAASEPNRTPAETAETVE